GEESETPETREAVQSINVGKYVVKLSLTGEKAKNYELDENDLVVAFEITPRPITVTLQSKDLMERYTGKTITIADWYEFVYEAFLGQDEGKELAELFNLDSLVLTPQFRQDGNVVDPLEVGKYAIVPTYTGTIDGNENYTVTIAISEEYGTLVVIGAVLELNENSSYGFVFEYVDGAESALARSGASVYREYYEKYGYIHGFDDREWDRIILGDIRPGTTMEEFLSNLVDSSKVKLYDQNGTLVYAFGEYEEQYAALANAKYFAVGTGWRVEYVMGDEIDTVYLSVLGDANGDGFVNVLDVSMLNGYIAENSAPELEEFRLAAYVTNIGGITESDASTLYLVIVYRANISNYVNQAETEEPEEPETPVDPEQPEGGDEA
ncbi:MAG: dockerin type I repeat-containing protein, partial [Clostridiales bacterium]|nr:dockerin type I repeat-containing protein [Clostridiales bacterium]